METQTLQAIGQISLLIAIVLLFYVCYRYLTITTITKENPYDPNRKDSFNKNQINKYENSSVVEKRKDNDITNSNYNPLGIPLTNSSNIFESTSPLLQNQSTTSDPISPSSDINSMTVNEVMTKIKDITNNEDLITSLEEDTSNSKVDFLGNLDRESEEETIEETINKQKVPTEPLRRRRKREWRDD